MNRSYSKIRHMQNSNLLLERRYLVEQVEGTTTTPTNSLQTMESLPVEGGPFKSMMGSTFDSQGKIIEADSDTEGFFKDATGQKYILNFTDAKFPAEKMGGSILIYNQSQFAERFSPETLTGLGVADGGTIEIRPNSRFIIFGEDPIKKTCNIVYIDNSNQVQGKMIKYK